MPPSIDPVTNIFGTSLGLVGRVAVSFLAGWAGNLIGLVSSSFENWRDYAHPADALGLLISGMGIGEHIAMALWPLMLLYFLAEAPGYTLFLVIVLAVCLFKIVFGDDPVAFWSVLMATALAPGLVITDGVGWSIPALLMFMGGLGAGLWYTMQLDHPGWADRIRESVTRYH